jgi:transcriptional regulator with XRE-family HTH domain
MGQKKVHHGQVLRAMCKRSKLSLEKIGDESGYSRSSLYRWFEYEELDPRILYDVSVTCGIDVSDKVPEVADLREKIARGELLSQKQVIPNPQMTENFKDKYMILLEKYSNLQSEVQEQQSEYLRLSARIKELEEQKRDTSGTTDPEKHYPAKS